MQKKHAKEGVAGLATAGTRPAPPCFRQPEPVEEVRSLRSGFPSVVFGSHLTGWPSRLSLRLRRREV